MLFINETNINPAYKSLNILTELKVNGQEQESDDNEAPVDYTADTDEGAEETPPPVDDTPESAPEDYTVPDEDERGDMNDTATANAQSDTTAGGDDSATDPAADTGTQEDPDAGTDTSGGDDTGGGEGDDVSGEGGEPPTDYTSDEGGGGGEGGDMEGGGREPAEGGDAGGETTGGVNTSGGESEEDNKIRDLEGEIFGDLSNAQMAIKEKELKNNFSNLYDAVIDIEERVNNISKDAAMIKPLEFISHKMSKLSDQISDYLSYTYETKSYTENMIMYNTFLDILNQINSILDTIRPENGSK